MMHAILQYLPIIPEVITLTVVLLLLILGSFVKNALNSVYVVCQLTLILLMVVTMHAANVFLDPQTFFFGAFQWDHLAVLLKLFTYITVFFCFMFSRQYNNEHDILQVEFYVLAMLSMLGMMVLISSADLLSMYLGLELLSLPIYAMVAIKRAKERCIEAALKYFVIGALASGFLLYGISFIFGLSHSIQFSVIATAMAGLSVSQAVLATFALVFIIAGIAFKLGAAPFHMWVPDVYDGAPNCITLFLSTAPKLAAFALLARLLEYALPALAVHWQLILIVLAMLSIAIGNLTAIVQTNIKRMLAYSSIAHTGYLLLGFCAATSRGYSASLFYMVTYVLTTVGAFGLLTLLSSQGKEVTSIDDLKGLNEREPWLAFMMLLVLFSLAGVPPLVGFVAKLGVLEALISSPAHLVWLAVYAIVFAIVGAYYYIRVVKVMYFAEDSISDKPIFFSGDNYIAMTLSGVAMLLLGIFPGLLFSLCRWAF